MTKVREKIFLGHEFDAHMDAVRINGITASLNVADDLNDPIYPIQKLICVKVGLADNGTNAPEMIELAVTVLRRLLEQEHIVLVHCRAGMSRSPHIVALYLSKMERRPYMEVWEELRALRPEVADRSKINL